MNILEQQQLIKLSIHVVSWLWSQICDREGKNSVMRCRNNVKGNKSRVKIRRKKSQKAPLEAITNQSTVSKIKPNLNDDNKRNFLRQFLKKSFFMTDLQAKSYRTDEYLTKLFYETARFSAFNHQWIVKAIINNSQRDVHQINDRVITYQVIFSSYGWLKMCWPEMQFKIFAGCFEDKNSIPT